MSGVSPHPAQRRRMLAQRPQPETHDVKLRAFGSNDGRAMIVGAEEQDFVEAVLADVVGPDAQRKLAARRGKRRGADQVLELSQAVHRRFHLILMEAHCVEPGAPRLDPRKLAGTGFVLRQRHHGQWHGWVREGTRRLGWRPLILPDADPESDAAPLRVGGGAAIGELLAARNGNRKPREEVHPLFVAPDDVCRRAGKTIL